MWLAIIAGVFFAADLLSWHHAVDAVGAGLATVLGNLQVIVVALVAWLVFGERPPRSVLIGLPIVLGGVVLISGVIGSDAYGVDPPLGATLGLITALAYAGYLLIIRRGSNDLRRPAGPVAISTASTMVVAIVAGVLLGELDPVPSWPSHGWLIAVGITSQSIGYLVDLDLAAAAAGGTRLDHPARPAGRDRGHRARPARRDAVRRAAARRWARRRGHRGRDGPRGANPGSG